MFIINTISNLIKNTTKDDFIEMMGEFVTSEFALGILGMSTLIGIPIYG